MSDNDNDDRYSDWLANSVHGYGFGHTEEQALQEMASNVPGETGDVEVDLIEHHGGATFGPGRWDVDEFVSGRRVTIAEERMNDLRDAAIDAVGARSSALGTASDEREWSRSEEGYIELSDE